jgi:asparagine synthase (glutamine-hydrolysing)
MTFVLIRWREPSAEATQSVVSRLSDLSVIIADDQVLLLADPATPVLSLGDEGAVLGVVFSQIDGRRLTAFTAQQRGEILASRGAALPGTVWGSYVAVLRDAAARRLEVLRDPSGAVRVHRWTSQVAEVLTSDIGLAERALDSRCRVDWDGVAQMLAYPQAPGRRTGLADVTEPPAGALLSWQDERVRETQLWTPWRFAETSRRIDDIAVAREGLRRTLERVVALWAEVYPDALLELSGGLDSSLIALCLPKSDGVSAINIVTQAADGDERDYARASAEAAGLRHVEAFVEPRADFRRARPGRFPRPSSHGYLQAIEERIAEVGRANGAKAFFSGKGGDNILCGVNTAGPGADALLAFGLSGRTLSTFADLARVHGCTVWTAAWLSVGKAVRPPRAPAAQTALLRPGLTAPAPDHPWLETAQGVSPGKRDHVRTLLVAHAFLDRYAHAAAGPVIAPMLSQPMIELCLRIPTWMWVDGGWNRAVARQAFASRLPGRVLRRTTKGGLDGFAAAVYRHARQDLAAFLADGRLAAAGLIDTPAVLRALERETQTSAGLTRLFQLADTEAWARTWD